MTIFITNLADFGRQVEGYLQLIEGMSKRQARQFFERNFTLDGGAYGEATRYHISEKVANDSALMAIATEFEEETSKP